MKHLAKTGSIVLLLAVSGNASAIIIQDNYVGSNSHGWGDVIGSTNRYQVQNMEVIFDGDYMNVTVNTNFRNTISDPDPNHVNYGDLFISTNGWNPYGSESNGYKYDNAINGEKWEFVFDTSAGKLYGENFTIRTSDYFFGSSGATYRNGQEVQRGSGGTSYLGSSVDMSKVGYGGSITYNILLSSLGLSGDVELGLKWGMTCANDTIEGAVKYTSVSVPEPSTLLLLGASLLGFGFTARKKSV